MMYLRAHCIYLLILVYFFLLSCVSLQTTRSLSGKNLSLQTAFLKEHHLPPSPNENEQEKSLGSEDLNLSNVPPEMHYKIEQWLFWFQGDGRERMNTYLSRSSKYIPIMQEILSQYHLPKDIVYVALIESGFSPSAVSHARAVGFWQFIRGTGQRYKLIMNSHIDERRDPILSTHAAAKYFKGLYSIFGSWHLAFAAYNVGENRVKNQLLRHHTRNFWELAQKGNIPAETVNYIPKFFAAMLIAKNPNKYGFKNIKYEPKLDFKEIEVNHSINLHRLAVKMGVDYQVLRKLNPKFLTSIAIDQKNQPLLLRVPREIAQESQIELALTQAKVNTPRILRNHKYYRVRRGDTLSAIAQRFRVSMYRLRSINGLRRSFIRIGSRLKIPTTFSRKKAKFYRQHQKRSISGSEKVYIVKRGDTLSTIAHKYRVSLRKIVRRNSLRSYSKIFAGSRLIIPK